MRQPVKRKENSKLKPVKIRLNVDLVSYPARAEGLINNNFKLRHLFSLFQYLSYPTFFQFESIIYRVTPYYSNNYFSVLYFLIFSVLSVGPRII